MAPETRLLEIGRIERPHGVRGDVIVRLYTNRTERLVAGTVLDSRRGPLTVARSSPHHDRWIVHFTGHDGRDAADQLRGVTLSAESVDDPDELWVHQLVGAEVVDRAGTSYGPVTAVIANPASDLLELADGRLVPLVFVVEQHPGVRVVVDVPPGLLDGEMA
jgi:16S rRNA processing protein RimM